MSILSGHGAPDILFGDASDGDVIVTSPVSLIRDMYYNKLIFSGSNAIINTNSFRIYAQSIQFHEPGGIIENYGAPGYGAGTPGTGSLLSTLSTSTAGGAGGVFGVGSQAFGLTSYGGSGGVGGAGGAGSGAAGGIVAPPAPSSGSVTFFSHLTGFSFGQNGPHSIRGGSGGGGGTGDGSITAGGGGGSGGGVVLIAAKEILAKNFVTGTINVKGGTGGDAVAIGNAGGGGGGGGGVVLIMTSVMSPYLPWEGWFTINNTASPEVALAASYAYAYQHLKFWYGAIDINVAPGVGGLGFSGGSNGATGTSGSVFILEV